MQMTTDLIIIGAGPGGYEAAAYAARHGLTVAIVESGEVGGTCLNRGCIPTKALVHSAELQRMGVQSQSFTSSIEHKDAIVKQLREGIEGILNNPNITLIKGHATLTSDKKVSVTAQSGEVLELSASNIIIATGSSPKMPPIEGIDDATVVTSDQLLSMTELPRRLCIIGAGVIGMEFASIFSAWGVEVTVVEYLKECLPTLDADIAKRLRKNMEKQGIRFVMQAAVRSIHAGTVSYERKGKSESVEADCVLVATGRAPITNGLGLEAVGIDYGAKGIAVNEKMQTNVAGIYAIGDVNGQCMLAHAATFQGYRAVNNILGKTDGIRLDIVPSAVFTYPEAASVGLTEEAAQAKGLSIKTGKAFHRANGRAMTEGETEGMVKLVVSNDTSEILGCHAYGLRAADMIQEVAALMNKNARISDLQSTIHIHPTVGEVLHVAAMSFLRSS